MVAPQNFLSDVQQTFGSSSPCRTWLLLAALSFKLGDISFLEAARWVTTHLPHAHKYLSDEYKLVQDVVLNLVSQQELRQLWNHYQAYGCGDGHVGPNGSASFRRLFDGPPNLE